MEELLLFRTFHISTAFLLLTVLYDGGVGLVNPVWKYLLLVRCGILW